jgi:hypothetical protein
MTVPTQMDPQRTVEDPAPLPALLFEISDVKGKSGFPAAPLEVGDGSGTFSPEIGGNRAIIDETAQVSHRLGRRFSRHLQFLDPARRDRGVQPISRRGVQVAHDGEKSGDCGFGHVGTLYRIRSPKVL